MELAGIKQVGQLRQALWWVNYCICESIMLGLWCVSSYTRQAKNIKTWAIIATVTNIKQRGQHH